MKGIVNAYTNVPLILRIVIGLAIGVILALVVPNNEWIAFLGTMFTSALKAIAPILVFFLVMGALSTARSAGNMKTVIIGREELRERLDALKGQLSELEGKILPPYLSGLTCAEIAKRVGRSPKSVDNAVQRIRRKVARQTSSGASSES